MSIYIECLEAIQRVRDLEKVSVADVLVTESYIGIQLDDGSIGWSLCYSNATTVQRGHRLRTILRNCSDPLLRDVFYIEDVCLLRFALCTSLLSALSKMFWDNPGAHGLNYADELPKKLLVDAERVLCVGFGGLMFDLLANKSMKALDIVDLTYNERKHEIDVVVGALGLVVPDVGIRVCESIDHLEAELKYDLVVATGSTLSNGTLSEILKATDGARFILQGRSAGIHPGPLFSRGVIAVVRSDSDKKMFDAFCRKNMTEFVRLVEHRESVRCLLAPELACG